MSLTSEEAGVRVRPAIEADEEPLAEIDRLTWSPTATPVPRWAPDKVFFRDAGHVRNTLVAHDGDLVIGFVVLEGSTLCASNAHVQILNGLAVHPDHQGRRVGRALMAAAEAMARRRGARRITLRVLGGNAPARALYLSCGYRIEGVLEGEFLLAGRYVDDVLMALDLTRGS
ncbi:GNAT family N-acetyltransferase [Embleya sp. NBC_00896]|uniref:GNAT family N-acetyltransferase n=1 Tax=Embleya sp. NBC_00896 TaxID=2975961 RepID=UPI00386A7105|nr:GNAT family N-acetyltransferase [Embleya sp. NBC_00896]